VDVRVRDFVTFEHLRQARFDLMAIDDVGVDHQVSGIVGPER